MKTRKSKSIRIAGLLGLAGLFIASCNQQKYYSQSSPGFGRVERDSIPDFRDRYYLDLLRDMMNHLPNFWYYGNNNYGYVSNSPELYRPRTATAVNTDSASGARRGGFGHAMFGIRGGA
jgi:hypothetical protein